MKILESTEQLKTLFKKHKNLIRKFYEINEFYENSDDLCKRAITGSTYRSFIRNEPKINSGMSILFKEVASQNFKKNPTDLNTKEFFLNRLKIISRGQFYNWEPDTKGIPKLLKLYNLYSNYWVAFQQNGDFDSKKSSISKLKVPLDKYSLTFISELYNKSENIFLKLNNNLSMGSIKSLDQYDAINKYIDILCSKLSKDLEESFFPIYIDIIQAAENNLEWYSINVSKSKIKQNEN